MSSSPRPTQPKSDAQAVRVLVNGQPFNVLEETNGVLLIQRPNGSKRYTAKRLGNSAIYGDNRAQIISGTCDTELPIEADIAQKDEICHISPVAQQPAKHQHRYSAVTGRCECGKAFESRYPMPSKVIAQPAKATQPSPRLASYWHELIQSDAKHAATVAAATCRTLLSERDELAVKCEEWSISFEDKCKQLGRVKAAQSADPHHVCPEGACSDWRELTAELERVKAALFSATLELGQVREERDGLLAAAKLAIDELEGRPREGWDAVQGLMDAIDRAEARAT